VADSIEWQLKLNDQMSAALRQGTDNATKLDQELTKVNGKLNETTQAESGTKEASEGLFAEFAEGAIAVELVSKITEALVELGEKLIESAIEVSDFGFRSEIALRHLNNETEGSATKTEGMLKAAQKFALEAALPVEQVTDAFINLRRAGLSDELSEKLTKSSAQLAALGAHPENFTELLTVFEQIQLKGELTGQALRGLASAGVSPAAIAARLGAKDFRDLQEQLEKKPIKAAEAFKIIQDLIAKSTHGDPLGEQSRSIGGSITRIKDAWEILLDDVLNKKDGAFGDLRGSFSKLVDDFIARLPELEAQFAQTFGPIIKAVDKFISDPEAIAKLFKSAVQAIQAVAAVIGPVVNAFEFVADHLDAVKQGAIAAMGPLGLAYNLAQNAIALLPGQKKDDDAGSHDTGGEITRTGTAKVHEGEFVIPPGGRHPGLGNTGSGSGGGGGSTIHAPIAVTVNIHGGHGLTEQGIKLSLEDILPGMLVSPFEKLASTIGAG
jgi:phage tail tape-measure protein